MTNRDKEDYDIKSAILAANFWENHNYLKELYRGKSSKVIKQAKATEEIRKEWIAHQKNLLHEYN